MAHRESHRGKHHRHGFADPRLTTLKFHDNLADWTRSHRRCCCFGRVRANQATKEVKIKCPIIVGPQAKPNCSIAWLRIEASNMSRRDALSSHSFRKTN